jgi:hypothetical protein
MSSCTRHPMDPAEHVCGRCGRDHCSTCVVHPFGPARPAMCIGCALAVGGVRSFSRAAPAAPRRTMRRKLRAARRGAAGSTPAPDPAPEPPERVEWLDDADEDLPGGWHVTY